MHTVAIMVETSKAYGRGLFSGIGVHARTHRNWNILVEERGLHEGLPEWFGNQEFDGVILRSDSLDVITTIERSGIAAVFLGETLPRCGTNVLTDDEMCSFIAVKHFVEQGFRNLAYVGLPSKPWSVARRERFLMEAANFGVSTSCCELGSDDKCLGWQESQTKLVQWLPTLSLPVGILCCYDAIAQNVINACRTCDLLIPEQISLIGVDNDEVLCTFCEPSLTSVAHDTRRIGIRAAQELDRLMSGNRTHQSTIVQPLGIVERESMNMIAIEDVHVARGLGIIRRKATFGINVEQVADQLPMSRRTFERKFREAMGCSPHDEIMRVRFEQVKRLLTRTDLSVEEIAGRCGFAYTSHMISSFRNRESITPSDYRSTHQEDNSLEQ